jgi:hypothetical protein
MRYASLIDLTLVRVTAQALFLTKSSVTFDVHVEDCKLRSIEAKHLVASGLFVLGTQLKSLVIDEASCGSVEVRGEAKRRTCSVGRISARHCTLGYFEIRNLQLDSHENGVCLNFEHSRVKGLLGITDIRTSGAITGRFSHLGQLNLDHLTSEMGLEEVKALKADPQLHAVSLSMRACSLPGGLYAEHTTLSHSMSLAYATFGDRIRLADCTVGTAETNVSIDLDTAVGAQVELIGVTCIGAVAAPRSRLDIFDISGTTEINCAGEDVSKVEGRLLDFYQTCALDLNEAELSSCNISGELAIGGDLSFSVAKVDSFVVTAHIDQRRPKVVAHDIFLVGMRSVRLRLEPTLTPSKAIRPLRIHAASCQTDVLTTDLDDWADGSTIKGLTYRKLESADSGSGERREITKPGEVGTALEWLARSPFDLDAYQQLSNQFNVQDRSGRQAVALITRKYYARQRGRLAPFDPRRLAEWIWWVSTRSGYKPLRLVGIGIGIVLIWSAVLMSPLRSQLIATDASATTQTLSARWSADTDCRSESVRCFNPVSLATEIVLPVLDLGQRQAWRPGTNSRRGDWLRWAMDLTSVVGWAMAAMGAVGVAQLMSPTRFGRGDPPK